jgi:hypothetical protein
VIAPPKPSIVWKLRDGSMTIVGALGCALVNGTAPASVSLSLPSAVVIQTRALVTLPPASDFGTADEEAMKTAKTSAPTTPSTNSEIRGPQLGPKVRDDM